ncbi:MULTISPECIES: hypothetical protein [Streptomyces]|uniref:hypothetical protein n=1 Tax=Streptomyces TaxID=1883 RepID=UPI0022497650|nr:hypothetical protein [Streptomyces sp. JHD 1]MCX2969459.1 hypothetical protein [Streptomyces sp. JHD 1]
MPKTLFGQHAGPQGSHAGFQGRRAQTGRDDDHRGERPLPVGASQGKGQEQAGVEEGGGDVYGGLAGSPYVARLLGGTLTGRLPNGMAPIAILLWITANGSSLAFGGLLSALYGLASALAQPVKGRLMDRYGGETG